MDTLCEVNVYSLKGVLGDVLKVGFWIKLYSWSLCKTYACF